jgi:hypothetical protein
MTSPRARLPNRRTAESFNAEAGGLRYVATVGRFEDGRVAEIFLTNHKSGSTAGIMASDSAVLCSIALQHGVPLDVLRRADARFAGSRHRPARQDRRHGAQG